MLTRSSISGALALSALCCAACSSQPVAAPAPTQVSHPPLDVRVLSVTPSLEAYNPAAGSRGIPAETVHVEVAGVTGPFTCSVVVFHDGHEIGSTIAGSNPASLAPWIRAAFDVTDTTGPQFTGSASDARLRCKNTSG
jgi:hypothetical protein